MNNNNKMTRLQYATSRTSPLNLEPTCLLAKISTSNMPSLALFHKLGFGIVKTSEVWQEHELRFGQGEGRVEANGAWCEGGREGVKEMPFEI